MGSGEESNASGATRTTLGESRGFGHVSLKVVLPEKKHKDWNFGFEDNSEGEEFERERGVTEREETAIEALH